MEGETKRNDVKSLLETIKSSNVLESRISLIDQLGDLYQSETSDMAILVESLPTFWEDSTCSGISQCMLNKTILHAAAKYLELDTASCLSHFLILGTKANMWCGKHLHMTIMSFEESQEEKHSSVFFQLVLDSLSFSSASISALTRSLILGEKVVMLIIENFILELLNLMKISISEIKKIQSIASEVLKVSQVILDAATRLCRAYSQAIKWDSNEVNTCVNEGLVDGNPVDYATHIINMTTCTIENLYELGILAAAGGGSLVTILNVSWKGVVSLLQLGKGMLVDKISIGDIILTLVSLANESLRCAAETWFFTSKEGLALSEAKRTFLPIKFYLINAVRISSEYPSQAIKVSREIIKCVLLITSFGISFSKGIHLRAASEASADLLEPTSFLLLHAILNSAEVKHESKLQILDWLFTDENNYSSVHPVENVDTCTSLTTSIDGMLAVDCEGMPRAGELMLGRVILFLNLLKSSTVLREEVVLGISTKLGYLLNCLMNEDVYSSILVLHIPVLCGPGPNSGVAWQPMLPFVLHALKTFMVVASSSSMTWKEVEAVLLQNIVHPHYLCLEIVMELWCFFMRHAETDVMNDIFDKLYSLLKVIASSDAVLTPFSALRNMARSICTILTYATQPTIDQVYRSIFSDDTSYLSTVIRAALLMEGFPLDSLSDNLKKLSAQKILTSFQGFIANGCIKLGPCSSSGSENSILLGLPVHALSSAVRCSQIKSSDIIDVKNISQVLKFTVSVIHGYSTAIDSLKDHYRILLGAILDIVSNMEHIYASDEIREVILELKTLFVVDSASLDTVLYQCKPTLASFMAGISHMEITESDADEICTAVWDLYHMLLREQHWAFIHLALMAFGYFAARTSCSQLWRFIPHDAALSFDTETGNEASEDRFMSELKAFLEKEVALNVATPCKDQLGHLVREGMVLKEKAGKTLNPIPEISKTQVIEIDDENQTKNKKRKLPDGISVGVALLQNGLKVLRESLSHTDPMEFKEEFSTHLSCLEDVLFHLSGLSERV